MSDPIDEAFKALHQGNLTAAEKAKVANLTYAGNELARVLSDVAESNQLDAIARAVVISTIAKWKAAKGGQDL